MRQRRRRRSPPPPAAPRPQPSGSRRAHSHSSSDRKLRYRKMRASSCSTCAAAQRQARGRGWSSTRLATSSAALEPPLAARRRRGSVRRWQRVSRRARPACQHPRTTTRGDLAGSHSPARISAAPQVAFRLCSCCASGAAPAAAAAVAAAAVRAGGPQPAAGSGAARCLGVGHARATAAKRAGSCCAEPIELAPSPTSHSCRAPRQFQKIFGSTAAAGRPARRAARPAEQSWRRAPSRRSFDAGQEWDQRAGVSANRSELETEAAAQPHRGARSPPRSACCRRSPAAAAAASGLARAGAPRTQGPASSCFQTLFRERPSPCGPGTTGCSLLAPWRRASRGTTAATAAQPPLPHPLRPACAGPRCWCPPCVWPRPLPSASVRKLGQQ